MRAFINGTTSQPRFVIGTLDECMDHIVHFRFIENKLFCFRIVGVTCCAPSLQGYTLAFPHIHS